MLLLWVAFACMIVICASTAYSDEPKDIPILQRWSGDYQIIHLNRLPQGQQRSRVGSIENTSTFANFWQAFNPGEKTPEDKRPLYAKRTRAGCLERRARCAQTGG